MSTSKNVATVPTVTSLASGDTVLCVSGGALKRISKTNLEKNLVSFSIESPQWVRVAQFSSGVSALIKIHTQWRNVSGASILMDLLAHPNGNNYNKLNVISRMINMGTTTSVSKIRIVRKKSPSTCYLDVYYSQSSVNDVIFRVIDNQGLTLLTPQLDAKVPEDYIAVEFNITSTGVFTGQ